MCSTIYEATFMSPVFMNRAMSSQAWMKGIYFDFPQYKFMKSNEEGWKEGDSYLVSLKQNWLSPFAIGWVYPKSIVYSYMQCH